MLKRHARRDSQENMESQGQQGGDRRGCSCGGRAVQAQRRITEKQRKKSTWQRQEVFSASILKLLKSCPQWHVTMFGLGYAEKEILTISDGPQVILLNFCHFKSNAVRYKLFDCPIQTILSNFLVADTYSLDSGLQWSFWLLLFYFSAVLKLRASDLAVTSTLAICCWQNMVYLYLHLCLRTQWNHFCNTSMIIGSWSWGKRGHLPVADHDFCLDWCLDRLDSGASRHLYNDSTKFVFMKKCNISSSIAKEGETLQAIGIGDCKITVITAHGDLVNLILHDVLYVPEAQQNLLRGSQLSQDRFQRSFR